MTNKTKVEECLEVDHIFSEWEMQFLEDMHGKHDVEKLTEKQQESLDAIYEKACESGE